MIELPNSGASAEEAMKSLSFGPMHVNPMPKMGKKTGLITDPALAAPRTGATGFWSRRRKARSVCRTGPCRVSKSWRYMKIFLWAPRPRRIQRVKGRFEETAIIRHQRRYSTTKLQGGAGVPIREMLQTLYILRRQKFLRYGGAHHVPHFYDGAHCIHSEFPTIF